MGLADPQKRVSDCVKYESDEQKVVLSEDKRQQESGRIKNESEDERNITLEEKSHHNL